MERDGGLIDNRLFREKILPLDTYLMVKKNGLRLLNKTVITNAADILSNIATKISDTIATNYPKNASVATVAPQAGEDRKISSSFTFTDTTE